MVLTLHTVVVVVMSDERVPFARGTDEGLVVARATSVGDNLVLPEAVVVSADVPEVAAHIMVEIPHLYTGQKSHCA